MTRIALLLAAVAGCAAPPPEAPIRDVRPDRVQRGESIVVEAATGRGRGFQPGAEATVLFDGQFRRPGGKIERLKVERPGRVLSRTRILVDADLAAERALGRADFVGVVSVKQGETILSSSPRVPFELEFFPPSLRSATFGAVAWLGERRLEDWLGLDVR
ncbi:MAG: hypothetical protein AABZ30_00940, partial [Myxococcota bacterium]